jgi:PRC-barrel domain
MAATGIVPALCDAPLRDREGLLLGRVEDLLFDATTNRPAWLVVALGDGRRTIAPAARARHAVDGMRVGVTADQVRGCPVTLTGPWPRQADVVGAARHYGVRRFAGGRGTVALTSAGPALDAARAA